jgi:hypothetical protein
MIKRKNNKVIKPNIKKKLFMVMITLLMVLFIDIKSNMKIDHIWSSSHELDRLKWINPSLSWRKGPK